MRPSNQTTITGVTLCHKKVGGPSAKGSTTLDDCPYLQTEAESASERQYSDTSANEDNSFRNHIR
jgi:hypothetical protein